MHRRRVKQLKYLGFNSAVSTIKNVAEFVTFGKNEEPIFDESRRKPIIRFEGVQLLHGDNVCINYNKKVGLWCQSGGQIVSSKSGEKNGFARFVEERGEIFENMAKFLAEKEGIDLDGCIITFHGKWCGRSVKSQKAISKIEKSFFLYSAIVTTENKDIAPIALKGTQLSFIKAGIFDINVFPKAMINIDFNEPTKIKKTLLEILETIQHQCPVAHAFGFDGGGKGILWEGTFQGAVYRFKITRKSDI